MTRRTAAALLLCALAPLLHPGPAAAQSGDASSDRRDRRKAYTTMGRACSADADTYCPGFGPLELRNLAICLKPYRFDLTLGCRSALRATSTPAAASSQ